jgi:Ribbon-helix-helix protein, copG family
MSDKMYRRLTKLANRTGLSVAELVRRAVERAYWRDELPRVNGFEISVGVWKRPDASIVGRRPGLKIVD